MCGSRKVRALSWISMFLWGGGGFLLAQGGLVDEGLSEWPDDPPALDSGDINGDWAIDLSDVVALLGYLFGGDSAPTPNLCGPADLDGDANGDERVNLSDGLYVLEHLFRGGPPPASPCADARSEMGKIAAQILEEPSEVRQDVRRALAATARLRTPDDARNAGFVTHFSVSCVDGLGIPLIDEEAYGSSSDPSRPAICYFVPDEHGELRIAALEWIVYEDNVPESPLLFGRRLQGPTGDLLAPFGIRSAYVRQLHLYKLHPESLFGVFNPRTTDICACGTTFCPR